MAMKERCGNWREWVKRFQAARTEEEILGLLSTGFAVEARPEDKEERLIHYLKWSAFHSYAYGTERFIANAAMDQLRKHIFAPLVELQEDNPFFRSWVWIFLSNGYDLALSSEQTELSPLVHQVLKPKVLKALVALFRVQEKGSSKWVLNLRNNADRKFLYGLVRAIWGAEDLVRKEAGDELYVSLRHWSLDFLEAENGWRIVKRYTYRFTEKDMNHLKAIAMSYNLVSYLHPIAVSRRVENIDEAVYAGSEAACLWKEAIIVQKVHHQLEERKRAEDALKAAKEKAAKTKPE